MSSFFVSVQSDDYKLDIESSNINLDNNSTGYAIIEINEQEDSTITLETSILETINNLEITRYNDYDLILTNTVYANLPDEIPMSIITGNLHVSRIDNLDAYLTTIPVDGGSP